MPPTTTRSTFRDLATAEGCLLASMADARRLVSIKNTTALTPREQFHYTNALNTVMADAAEVQRLRKELGFDE